MPLPIRCFSCGKVLGGYWKMYYDRLRVQNLDERTALDQLKITRYCCRSVMLTTVPDDDRVCYDEPPHPTFTFRSEELRTIPTTENNQNNQDLPPYKKRTPLKCI